MPIRRLVAIIVLAVVLAPGTWVRTRPPAPVVAQDLAYRPIATGQESAGDLAVSGAWHLTSPNTHFGSYSALITLPDGQLLAASDRGRYLRFPQPAVAGQVRFGWLAGDDTTRKRLIDIEAMTRDPATGRTWLAYEGTNTVERRNAALGEAVAVQPEAMAGFGSNSGPEAFARLADGRFIVMAEGPPDWASEGRPGFLFARDPVESGAGIAFSFAPPAGYSPVDMTQIPDGRVLILVRRVAWGIPPTFPVRLIVADPAEIAEDGVWEGREIARIADPLPSDNYEGLAVVPQPDGSLVLWLISDDNNSAFQRTLLLALRWDPRPARTKEKARGQAPRRSLSAD